MGFIDPLTPAQQGISPFPFLFNVVRAVGKNCPNLEDDVKLIHYFLIKFYDNSPTFFPNVTRPNGVIDFNSGAYSAATENWITKCQIDLRFNGMGGALDKRIDRIINKDNSTGSLSKSIYTLSDLNFLLQRFDPLGFLATPRNVPVIVGSVPPPSWDVVGNSR